MMCHLGVGQGYLVPRVRRVEESKMCIVQLLAS